MRQAVTIAVLLAGLGGPPGWALSADRTLTATGTIVRIDAPSHTVVVSAEGVETTFVWTADTKIAGTLSPGARVVVRYTQAEGGRNVALQITVTRS